MLSRILRTTYEIVRVVLAGAVIYGTVVPAYSLVEGLEDLHQLAQSARQEAEARTDEYHGQRFDGMLQWAKGKEQEGEQAVIRRFRRSIEDIVGIDCNTSDSSTYEMPVIKLGTEGVYELRMECRMKELVISFPKAAVELHPLGK